MIELFVKLVNSFLAFLDLAFSQMVLSQMFEVVLNMPLHIYRHLIKIYCPAD